MNAGGVDWPFGVTITMRFTHSVSPWNFVEWCVEWCQVLCRKYRRSRAGGDGLSQQEDHQYVKYADCWASLLGVMGPGAQGLVLLTMIWSNTFQEESFGYTVQREYICFWMHGDNVHREKVYKNAYRGDPTTYTRTSEAGKKRFAKLLYEEKQRNRS